MSLTVYLHPRLPCQLRPLRATKKWPLAGHAIFVEQIGRVDRHVQVISEQFLDPARFVGWFLWRVPDENTERKFHNTSINVLSFIDCCGHPGSRANVWVGAGHFSSRAR